MPVRDSGDFVDQVSAVKAWAQAAHDILVATAADRSTIQYQALARQVQKVSGINTTQPASKWVGPLLGVIARQCQARQLPLLTALCVRRDGTVGPAYDEVLRFAHIPGVVGDPDEHAERQRNLCYRQWQGARTAAPQAVAGTTTTVGAPARPVARNVGGRTPKKEPLQGNVCPNCFMQMSLTGVCDNCD